MPAGQAGNTRFNMLWFVYILKSEAFDRFYRGMTQNIPKRLKEQNHGKMKSTMAFKPWKIVYSEKCTDRSAARKRELYFKSGAGREYIKSLL